MLTRAWLALLPILISACAAATTNLAGTEWILEGSRTITLQFDDETAGGYAGCNWYGGRVEVERGRLRFQEISSTARGCAAAGVGERERQYLSTIGQVRAYEAEGDRLSLMGSNGEVLLRFQRRIPLDMNPAELIGTRWHLRSNPRVTLAFSESNISGFAGCRGYTGTFVARGDRLDVTSIAMNETECDQSQEVLVAEGDFTTALSETVRYRLTPSALELFTVGGTTLSFDRD